MTEMYKILVINPGSTSTKIGVFGNREMLFEEKIEHHTDELASLSTVEGQYLYRKKLVLEFLERIGIGPDSLHAVVGRGGLLRPVSGGTYIVNEMMRADLIAGIRGEHASNLAALIAFDIATENNIPAYVVDPVTVDEMEEVARVSGWAEVTRDSKSHALNMKAVARKVAAEMGKEYAEVNFVVAHLGSGISVAPHRKGRMIDVNGAIDEGPFSPERCGGLPAETLARICFTGKYTEKDIIKVLYKEGGVYSYLSTKDMRQVERMADGGNEKARLILEAMAYQTAKEIGAMSTVLFGQVDRIILTGGIAYSQVIVPKIIERVEFIAPVIVVPGEEELRALAMGALRVLRGEEQPKTYPANQVNGQQLNETKE